MSTVQTKETVIALLGQPNSGKSTLFNGLTGLRQHVGNWPGKTVEQKEGYFTRGGVKYTVADLPGTYSLSANSDEEIITRDYIAGGKADVVVILADASQLERSLFMLADFAGIQTPAVLLLNLMDVAKEQGKIVDAQVLEKKLGIPVVPITARTGEGLEELLHTAHRQMHLGFTVEPDDLYDDYTHDIHHRMGELIHDYAYAANLPAHWASIKLLEGDEVVLGKSVGSDARRGKSTFVTLKGVEKCEQLVEELTEKAKESLRGRFENSEFLCWLADQLVRREK